MGNLHVFQEKINNIKNIDLLIAAEDALRIKIDIENLKIQIEKQEDEMVKGDRGLFYFDILNLSEEDISLAANTVVGRKAFLESKNTNNR